MDDLDHSMRIADEDWSSFYQESEECRVPRPLLARPEGLRRPDSSISVTRSLQSSGENITTCVKVEVIQGAAEEERAEDDEGEICHYTGISLLRKEVKGEECIPEETKKSIIQTLEAVVKDVARTLPTQRETDVRGQGDFASSHPPREEKERWFVTLSLNDNLVPLRPRATPRRKKTKVKSTPQREKSEVRKHRNAIPSPNVSKEEVNSAKLQNISEGTTSGGDTVQILREISLQSKRHIEKHYNEGTAHDDAAVRPDNQEGILQNDGEGNPYDADVLLNHRKGTLQRGSREAPILQNFKDVTVYHEDVQTNREGEFDQVGGFLRGEILQNIREATFQEITHLERVESDDFEDSVEFFALHSSGSEVYLSAAESVDRDLSEEDSVESQPTECPSDSSLSQSLCGSDPVRSSECLQGRDLRAADCDKTSDQDPTVSSIQAEADQPKVKTEPRLRTRSGGGHRSVPDVVVTPVADGPEAYVQAAGRTPCVYAISAFWDEMEKLTINDILRLRMGKSPPPTETSESPSQSSSLVDPEEHHLTDGGLTDVSDAADSDYFTQPDDSKTNRSSWDFSACDFEDDYWQYLGVSRNTSPDQGCKTQQGEEDEEGGTRNQTPVPVEESARQNLIPRRMTKNKSLQNVRALNPEDEKKSKEGIVNLKDGPSLGSTIPAPVQGEGLESFPEAFITQGTSPDNVFCIYDPESTSLAPICDDTFRKIFFPTQNHKWKPVPIFSWSHPTTRELALPKWDSPFLRVDFQDEDATSPVRIVSHALRVARNPSGRSLPSFGEIRFQNKGGIWGRRSEGWILPAHGEGSRIVEGAFPQGTIQRPVREGVLSVLQQSDVCLLCIAFASWVLTSSDPDSADAWKAALLANVSALSAIQYLRQTK